MIVYAESSALLASWMRQAAGAAVGQLLSGAEQHVTSDLTRVECGRAFLRAARLGAISLAKLAALERQAQEVWAATQVLAFTSVVVERARTGYALEPLRTLDALHLAFYEQARRLFPGIAMLSLDERAREAARALGGPVLPE
ncbi:MAG: type II toxin-antitoxin system VapC family toxin [Terriglobales bacterium]